MHTAKQLEQKMLELAHNLWWTWHPEALEVWRGIDPELWRRCRHSPISFIKNLNKKRIESLCSDLELCIKINKIFSDLERYLKTTPVCGGLHVRPLQFRPVAYFCAEFGIHESLPLYSGGLGVLAGDHLKSASDLGIPMVGVSLFYRQGYFRQRISETGEQIADQELIDPEDLPLTRVIDQQGQPLSVKLPIQGDIVEIGAWAARLGRVQLFFLDIETAFRKMGFQELGLRLYGGDEAVRLAQEMILGIGGMKLLLRLGITPGVIHLNEGHSAFAAIEYARHLKAQHGLDFSDALRQAGSRTVFTTHTPVAAGHDRFSSELIGRMTWQYQQTIGLDHNTFMDLGRIHMSDSEEPFCMTVLALKTASRNNAVSSIHGKVSRRLWRHFWSGRSIEQVSIGHITNGINVLGWLAPAMKQLFHQYFPPDWEQKIGQEEVWHYIHSIPDEELWNISFLLKTRLLGFLPRSPHRALPADAVIEPHALTIGCARRFADYKRITLLLDDPDRLHKIVTDPLRPVQIIFSGKAHPRDKEGQRLIAEVYSAATDPRFAGKLIFVEDYDMNVGRHLVQGVDLWLNIPRAGFEACGTSGMKVALNGGLNLSILDGWWPEGYDGSNGFGVSGSRNEDNAIRDQQDREAVFDVLEKEVIPLYYRQDGNGIPHEWIRRMKEAMYTLGWRFSSDRMVLDYTENCYIPLAGISTCQMNAPFV
jgi:starch phosphorylase